jgi:hypothetical protein
MEKAVTKIDCIDFSPRLLPVEQLSWGKIKALFVSH